MPRRNRFLLAALLAIIGVGTLSYLWRTPAPAPVSAPPASYAKALRLAHDGQPGAARLLYQQLQRTDLSPMRRAALYAELPNYPSSIALKLAKQDLANPDAYVRRAAVMGIQRLLPPAQRSMALGPLLDDDDDTVRHAVVDALLGLSPDAIGLYFSPLQEALEAYQAVLASQPDDADAQLHLARLYLHEADYTGAASALRRCLALNPHSTDALATQVRLLEREGEHDASREVLAKALLQNPDSAFLQHELGLWLTRHAQTEYALLAFSKAVELEPDDADYRYTLATTLHKLDQIDAAQTQLQTLLDQHPNDRRARLRLIGYWKETGQLQNVQVLSAELERQNPDDPALQQGL